MDCDILVGVHLPTVDAQWWTMYWGRRDVLLIWVGFWGRCSWWGLVPNSPCRCLVIDRRKWTWWRLITRDYFSAVPGVGAWGWNPTGFWNGTWGPDTIGIRDWTIDGEGSFFDLFLDWELDWGWVTKFW